METENQVRALIVDDHPLVADAISGVLLELYPDIEIVGALTAEEGLRQFDGGVEFEVIVLDLALPGMSGFGFMNRARDLAPSTPVVVVSGDSDPESIGKAIHLGAAGFIPKSSPRLTMMNAFRLVMSGEIYIPPEAIAYPRAVSGREPELRNVVMTARQRKKLEAIGLTPREIDVLELLVAGHGNKRIAQLLGIAEATIKAHVTNILRAFAAENRTQVVYRITQGDFA
jgi:DNA-binding NarL/FixJ family response regulator